MRFILDSMIVGVAALGFAGAFDKFVPSIRVGPVNIPAYIGAGIGAGIALYLMRRVG